MFAVIKTGGKQYRVAENDVIVVEKLEGEPGGAVTFADVLMVGEGAAVTVGAPVVAGATVTGELVDQRKGEKIKVFKKRRRNTYRRKRGHRQHESVVRITAIASA
jgi:large subunit ribosomal protein L21